MIETERESVDIENRIILFYDFFLFIIFKDTDENFNNLLSNHIQYFFRQNTRK